MNRYSSGIPLAASTFLTLILLSPLAIGQNISSTSTKENTALRNPGVDATNSGKSNAKKNESETKETSSADGYVTKARSEQQKKNDEYLIKELKRVPGVNLKPKDMETEYPDWVDKPIRGFHPVKRMLQPVIRLGKNSTELQKQIMRLEGPIAGLQGPMLGLHKRMSGVEKKMDSMKTQMGGVQSQLGGMENQVRGIAGQMSGIRHDLGVMRKELNEIETPIRQLKDPITGVATPLTAVRQELVEMKTLLATVLFAIVVAAIAVAVGTPIAAVLIYFHRHKIFPKLKDDEFPVAKVGDKQSYAQRTT